MRIIIAMVAMGLLLTVCLPAPGEPVIDKPAVIYVARRHWHIDVGFAIEDLAAPLDSLSGQFPAVKYLFFGFGDRHYLMAKYHKVPAMLGALMPGSGILLVTGLRNTPAQAFGPQQVVELRVSAAQARAAQAFIRNSFVTLTPVAEGPYAGSLYFSAVPRYSAFHTCNTWAAEALRAGELPIRTSGVLLAGQLWRRVKKFADIPLPEGRSPARGTSAPWASLPR